METVTNSMLKSAQKCPYQCYLRYVLGIQRDREAQPLRMGSVFHWGQELRGEGDPDYARHACQCYASLPPWADAYEWAVERETVRALIEGHAWRYQADTLEVVANEVKFEVPLVSGTGRVSRRYVMRGKIDKIVRLADGRLALQEYKTASEDMGPDAPYWKLLRYDMQVGIYMLAARASGYDVACCLYDVTRKPGFKPANIPQLDANGDVIVLDANGNRVMTAAGKPRKPGDSAKGYVVQSRPETPEEYGQRVLEDMYDKPEVYFQRREISRTEDQLASLLAEIDAEVAALSMFELLGCYPKRVSKWHCPHCEFNAPCQAGVDMTAELLPDGYRRSDVKHPELEEE